MIPVRRIDQVDLARQTTALPRPGDDLRTLVQPVGRGSEFLGGLPQDLRRFGEAVTHHLALRLPVQRRDTPLHGHAILEVDIHQDGFHARRLVFPREFPEPTDRAFVLIPLRFQIDLRQRSGSRQMQLAVYARHPWLVVVAAAVDDGSYCRPRLREAAVLA